ncbi:hypothetical protein H6G80_05895 [Nostoc sp. FACHB-87]|nr:MULTISPECIES: hypothetical protein [Nostocales]MBD2299875.1 hypothetical protein [Nostoc sp. FACHB-190]MBD2453607.1 hypothetical protein [Nostoc sp. FACHB-87]MBD2475733.1 hypothetical protein [Anabaena sp. FACHB-83]MBD2492236.1 hypothetical protein [Aulosira sp. FACHB-615]
MQEKLSANAIAREINDRKGEVNALGNLGVAYKVKRYKIWGILLQTPD